MNNFLLIHSGDMNSYMSALKEVSPKVSFIVGDVFYGAEAKRRYMCYQFYKDYPLDTFKSPIYLFGKSNKRMDMYDNLIFKTHGYFGLGKLPLVSLLINTGCSDEQISGYSTDHNKANIIFLHNRKEEIVFTDSIYQLIYNKNPKLVVFYGNKKFKHFKFPISDTECLAIGRNNTILYDIEEGSLFSLIGNT